MPTNSPDASTPHEYEKQSAMLSEVLEGNSDAWAALVSQYSPVVYGTAVRIGLPPDDAADVAQSVWLALLEASAGIRDSQAVPRWLAVTTRRIAIARLRRHLRGIIPLPDDLESEAPSVDELLEAEDRIAEVRGALETLSPRCRELLLSLFTESRPNYQDISARLQVPVGSIGPTRARCLTQLYQVIQRRRLLHSAIVPRSEGS